MQTRLRLTTASSLGVARSGGAHVTGHRVSCACAMAGCIAGCIAGSILTMNAEHVDTDVLEADERMKSHLWKSGPAQAPG